MKTADIKDKICPYSEPAQVLSSSVLNIRLPKAFEYLSPQSYWNKYPFNLPYAASLHVDTKYSDLDSIQVDFHFFGSTLEMLANKYFPSDSEYLALLIPGTSIINIFKHTEYEANHSDVGYQFERFVNGKPFIDKHNHYIVEHIQFMEVAGYCILFSAEVHGSDGSGNPVAIKSSNPNYFGTKTLFHMISNGSLMLASVIKGRG